VVVTGEQVDIHYAFPFEFPPQVWQGTPRPLEGATGQFYCLRRLCCRNSHGDEMPIFLRCETQENPGTVSSPQLAGV
jgi:hypothetical protein